MDTRSLATRIKLENDNFEILPGSLLEIIVKYNEEKFHEYSDTSLMMEGDKTYVYKVAEDNMTNKS